MRIFERTIVALMMGTALLAAPAIAEDGAPIDQPALSLQSAPCITSKKSVPPAPENAASSLSALQQAAEDGDLIAQWKLGRMYAEGNGVAQTTSSPSTISTASSKSMAGTARPLPRRRSWPTPLWRSDGTT
jgi:TPR repeat protein